MGIEHIVEAENGKAAVTELADTMFDLVLTDYNMPEMDGRALVEYIRTQSWQTEVPILMLTSENNQGRLAAVEKAGVSAICDKPFDQGNIRNLIIQALRK
jgi:two-component system chemotaxis response regulator CheY